MIANSSLSAFLAVFLMAAQGNAGGASHDPRPALVPATGVTAPTNAAPGEVEHRGRALDRKARQGH